MHVRCPTVAFWATRRRSRVQCCGRIPMKTGLAALVHPHSPAQFLALYAQGTPLVVAPQPHNVFLQELPFLASLQALLSSWPLPIEAHLPDVRDESHAVTTSATDAPKLFANGMGLLFSEAHLISPVLNATLEELRQDLGLSELTQGRCLIYATPDKRGTAAHFDQNINFVLQVRGTKTWTLARNEHVTNPLTRHTIGAEPDPELASYLEAPLPERMPPHATSFELTPGSLLFLPRGHWHETCANGDALSLNFTFSSPSWLDLFTAALRGRLAQSPEWRETADGVSDQSRRKAAEARLDSLLCTLTADFPHWKAKDILEATG